MAEHAAGALPDPGQSARLPPRRPAQRPGNRVRRQLHSHHGVVLLAVIPSSAFGTKVVDVQVVHRRMRSPRARTFKRVGMVDRHCSLWRSRARHQLLLTSPAFDLPAHLPPNVQYVGPVLDDPSWAEVAPAHASWSPPPGDDPLVLVALSSTFQDQGGTLQRIVDGLAYQPVRGLVTTGLGLDPAVVRAPENVTVVRAAPHTAVLAHAALVVTHGGHGTVIKSLTAGLPLVVLPHGRDQADNAVWVTERGAGIRLRRTARPKKIARAVRRVMEDSSYTRAAAVLGEGIRRDAESGALVETLEDLPCSR
jgi:UDP:flavonoid glycosyltransferase YjiC (YdhE family)